MSFESTDKIVYENIKNNFTLEKAYNICANSTLNTYNNIEESEDKRLEHGKALIYLEQLGKIDEVKNNISNKLHQQENGEWKLRG